MAEPLDPDAADRVLRRAGDLADDDAGHTADAEMIAAGGIEPEAIISAAIEVGIPERAVRQSLAIEQLGPLPQARRLDSVAGSAAVWVQRVVELPPDEVLDLLDRWLVGGHHLRRERQRPDQMEWSRRDDVFGGLRRSVRGLSGEGRLGRVGRVHAAVRPVDPGQTVVRVTADRHTHRRAAVAGGSTLAVGAATVGVVGIVMTAPIAFAAIPVGVAGGFVFSSSRSEADRFERELERLLDDIERSRAPEGMLGGIKRRLSPRRRR